MSRRRFLTGIGIVASGVAIEAARNLVRPVVGAGQEGMRRTARSLVKAGQRVDRIGVERLAGAATPTRQGQPSLGARYVPELRVRIGQMLMVGFSGSVVDASSGVVRDIVDRGLGGVIIFDRESTAGRSTRNVESPNQLANLVATLQSASRSTPLGPPLLVAVDLEGGSVARLGPRHGFPSTYTAASLGLVNDAAWTQAQGRAIAQTLAAVGINLNLAPVVDLNLNPANSAINGNGRTFSGDAVIAAAHAGAFIAGHSEVGVRTAIKHFPGQGSAGADTHRGVVDVTARWTEYELEPFGSLIGLGIVDAVMAAHIFNAGLDASHPSSLSHATITGLLRNKLGYGGVVISDDLNMGAIRSVYGYEEAVALAVQAGVDILTVASPDRTGSRVERTIDIIAGLVANGTISEDRIDASYGRIMTLKDRLLAA